ncbi:tyrosine-type recombinase/integrase [Natronobacterium gregoryi]|uniref:Integrase n=2 Tax=Natronobacterium gregoryi TaxID=44930 RepID=L0AP12_NATGS|nr:site-specific integrase [Natronobacterium gregoryi]AFZ74830.1 site-specific recombinase XerD [Natronobacterium gregoryi SP2]ELY66056.1 integrase family protein [Natronobacterium gregoryi SP2]PLK17737.1 integrase [Natronobacterium gregoryi SP2]SFJ74769.1 Site-specific recombinase XerD [Natronobacterium gregoryi]
MTERHVHPRKARRDFLKAKRATLKQSSARAYEYPIKHFVQFLETEAVESMQEVDGYLIEQWKLDRQKDDLAPATFRNNVKKIKTFINWCEASSLVTLGLADSIDVPTISEDDEASHEHITFQRAQKVLNYLDTYRYASREHALFYTLWETGCRISGAVALDVGDLDQTKRKLEFVDRKEEGTALKNGRKGVRNVTLSEDLIHVLTDYIEVNRHDVRDDFNRRPLFTTPHKRLERQRAYKNIVGYTRPCHPF